MSVNRKELVFNEIKKIFASSNERVDAEMLKMRVVTAVEDWFMIPDEHLANCCQRARGRRAIVKDIHVVQEWDILKQHVRKKETGVQGHSRDANGTFIPNGTFYHVGCMPHVFWSDRMIYLRDKSFKHELNDDEIREWVALKDKRWDAVTIKPHPDRIANGAKLMRANV